VIQGRAEEDMWVTEFEIKYSEDGEEWQNIKNEEGGTDF
jgi:hypothetical protein